METTIVEQQYKNIYKKRKNKKKKEKLTLEASLTA